MSSRNKIVLGGMVLLLAAIMFGQRIIAPQDHTSTYVNSVLAVRGFRHPGVEVSTGDSATYEVGVGEEFKVTWKMENATEKGQVIYHGPAGVGAGLVPISFGTDSSQSAPSTLAFTAQKPGTAQFLLTVTGPGPDGIYTLTSNLTVTIK